MSTSVLLALSIGLAAATLSAHAGPQGRPADLDKTVQAFLDRHRGLWRDMNVPDNDGRILHDIIVKHGYTRALEIGTSTGHSGIWIAWALSKTGGRLTTIEIDPRRHQTAVANFTAAGLSSYIDARLGDAHEIVPGLTGPFDFVFSDADKDWYTKYLVAVWPKVTAGGCFTAHNVAGRAQRGIREFLDHLKTLEDARTTIDTTGGGISISYKIGR